MPTKSIDYIIITVIMLCVVECDISSEYALGVNVQVYAEYAEIALSLSLSEWVPRTQMSYLHHWYVRDETVALAW